MAVIPVDFAQVNMRFSGSGYLRGAEVVFGVDNEAGATPAAICTEVVDAWTTNVKGVQGTALTLKEVYVKLGPNATGADSTLVSGENGDLSSNLLSSQVAVLVRKLTASGGRKNKGKMFWPGATEDQTDGGGLLSTAGLGAWATAIGGFWTQLGTADMPMVILHTSGADAPTPVVNVDTQQLMATQRRRIRKVGGRRTTP